MSIQYDSTSILSATYVTRRVQHESSADRQLDTMKLTRKDGEIIIDDSLAPKIITVEGVLVGTSLSDLEDKIDTLKELVARKDKNLDITFGSGTRRYVCRMTKVTFDRDHFNIKYVPYVITFFVATGLGKDISETTAKNTSGIVVETTDAVEAFTGSYQPKPRHKITITTRGNADVIRMMNVDTGEYMDVELNGFTGGDYLEIDEENQTVKKNGTTNLDFSGKFPSVIIGNNNMRLVVYGSGYVEDQFQYSNDGGSQSVHYDNGTIFPLIAQSVVMSQSGEIGKIAAYVQKTGSPTGKMQWHFRKDANGVPDMSATGRVGNAEFDIAAANVPSSDVGFTEIVKASGSTFLTAGVRYWLVLNVGTMTGTSVANFYAWRYNNIPTNYLPGKVVEKKTSSTGTWADGVADPVQTDGLVAGQFDMTFRIYRGDGAAPSFSVVWQTYYTKKYL